MEGDELLLSQLVCEEAERLGWAFLAEILEAETERYPENLEALAELGHVYTRQGRYEQGLAVDRHLVSVSPTNPTAHYNLACSLSLLGFTSAALDALERAVELGYSDGAFMAQDEDLRGVRGDERFSALVQSLRPGEG